MKKLLFALSTVLLGISGFTFASPGGLDANGGHYCRTNCSKYGYKTNEYHCHKSYCKLPSAKKMTIKYIKGPNGGCYYVNNSGNKTYVDKSYCK